MSDQPNHSTERVGGDSAQPLLLPDRLIEAALDLMASDGLEAVTLRATARRVGVSHGAPLRHFKSHSDLLAEVAAHGFRLLKAAIDEAADRERPSAGPLARIHSAGAAYIETAVEYPALFGLMFRPDCLDVTNPRFISDSAAAFDSLAVLVRSAQDSGWHKTRPTRLLAGIIWAHVHGLAALWSQGAIAGVVPEATLQDAIALSLEIAVAPEPPTL